MQTFRFAGARLPAEAEAARADVRAFLAKDREIGGWEPHRTTWTSFDAAFSARAGAAGFIATGFPEEYGGKGAPMLVRFAIAEDMLAAGAPCGAHWVAERQSGPQILRHGSDRAKAEILPRIAAGDCFFGIGMSEPGSGSDLAAVRTRAVRDGDGWRINGAKIWTSNAHRAHYLIALVRTGEAGASRHAGLTQFVIDLSAPGVTTRPIHDLAGNHEFNEVFFEDFFVPDDMRVGGEGDGWSMVTAELAFERAGPDRYLSDIRLLVSLIDEIGAEPDRMEAAEIGRMTAHLAALRRMSASVSSMLDEGASPVTQAALVKDVGTGFERMVPETARRIRRTEPGPDAPGDYAQSLAETVLRAPSFTLRGGTQEILRGMIARGLGLR